MAVARAVKVVNPEVTPTLIPAPAVTSGCGQTVPSYVFVAVVYVVMVDTE